MPVNVDNNLIIKNNSLEATYNELFDKLNVAYAWTHTQSTSSGGTAVLLTRGSTDILHAVECSDFMNSSIGEGADSGSYPSNLYIIDGKLYYNTSLTQIGTSTNWKETNGYYIINDIGELWVLNTSNYTLTQKHTDKTWVKLSKTHGKSYAIDSDGYLYNVNSTTLTPVGNIAGWTDISTEYMNSNVAGICNGKVYSIADNNSITLLDTQRSNYIHVINDDSTVGALTADGEVYVNTKGYETPLMTNVKGIYRSVASGSLPLYLITNDNKLHFWANNVIHHIRPDMEWSCVIGQNTNNFYGISDGKLYYVINPTSTPILTQIGTGTEYKTVDGNASLILATAGENMVVTHTILTTKTPQQYDNTYIDRDLTKYSIVQSATAIAVTDQYRTYNRDISKDSTFTAIPPATMHETVSTVDFLRVTKSDN